MGRELATTSWEFEYPHRKFRCKMLIGNGVDGVINLHAKTTKQTPNATYKTTKVKFSELKLPTPNLLSKAKPLNVTYTKNRRL